MNKNYVKNLENVIKQMLSPLRNIPLNLVIESLTGCKITPFNKSSKRDKKLLTVLIEAAQLAGRRANAKGIPMKRSNEVGNAMEPFVKNVLVDLGCPADTPKTVSGVRRAMGYPDLEFVDKSGVVNYLEIKTFNIENIDTSQRSFYLSPSEDSKITKDAHHLVMSFEVYIAGRSRGQNVYKCKSWKILTLENLLVDVKYEFNADNARLYSPQHILAEGQMADK